MSIPTHRLPGISPMMQLDNAGVTNGNVALIGELEKRKPYLNQPLTSVTWQRDIPVETGGGYVEFVSNYFVDYASAGTNQYGIIGGNTNVIPTVQAALSKDNWPVFPWANILLIPFIDQKKVEQIGRSLEQILQDGLQLNYQKALDTNCYTGFSDLGTYGLVNSPNVTSGLAAVGASTYRYWQPVAGVGGKTPTEIMTDVNTAINNAWAASQYDPDGIPDSILIPPANFSYINNTIVSTAGNESILTYLLKNNIARAYGVDLKIFACRQTIAAGVPLTTGGAATQRMVAYRNDKKRLQFDITQPLARVMTTPDAMQMAFVSPYLAFFSALQFKSYQTIDYTDGI